MKKTYKIISIILICFLILGIVTIGTWIINGKPPAYLTYLFPSKTRTILVLGMDNEGLRSDVMMLAFMNGKTGDVNVVSVPRDTMVKIGGRTYKINSAYAVGGIEQTKKSLETLLGVEIDNYIKFSFKTFSDVIDVLGGVNYDVPQDMYYDDPYQDLHIDLKAGYQHLDGDEAQQLVRFRQYPMGDEDRIKVQQDFLKQLIKQKLNLGTVVKAPLILSKIKRTVETDIPQGQWLSIAGHALKMNKESLKTHQMPGVAQNVGGLSYYIQNKTETKKLINEITE